MHLFLTMIKPSKQKLVLIGAGHVNLQVLHGLAQVDRSLFDLILISDVLLAPYSGMIPSFLVGDFKHPEIHFDLKKICDRLGYQFIHDRVEAINSHQQFIWLQSGSTVSYDLASINVGIQPQPVNFRDQKSILFVKPISGFIERWKFLDHLEKNSLISVVGGGAGAFEIAVACQKRFNGKSIQVQLITGDQGLLSQMNIKTQKYARAALDKLNIKLFEGSRVQEQLENFLKLENGKLLPTTVSLIATSAQAPEWFKTSGLPVTTSGFICVQKDLLVEGQKNLFAAGDCCEFVLQPLPKAGVFAVRQGPILLENIKSLILRKPNLKSYKPQKDFLTILVSGHRTAIASKGSWSFEGRLAWILKKWIDQRFMKRFIN